LHVRFPPTAWCQFACFIADSVSPRRHFVYLRVLPRTGIRLLVEAAVFCLCHHAHSWISVVNTPASYSVSPGFKSLPRRLAILIEVFRGFPQSLQTNSWIVP
jgi:hypothetical protein